MTRAQYLAQSRAACRPTKYPERPATEAIHQAAVEAIKTANANCDLARARAHAAVRLLHKAFSISPSATTAAKVS